MLPTRAVLGTMHGKETAIGPPLAAIGIALDLAPGLNTDRFGTFSGETPRLGSMVDAARAKAGAAMAATGLDAGLASEGAYGPHPAIPFVGAGLELLMWRDAARGYEVVERLVDPTPAYDHAVAGADEDLRGFLARVGFPGVALVVAPAAERTRPLAKGLRDDAVLRGVLRDARRASDCGRAFLQTDMRAHMNPRRMETIGRLAARLADRLARSCENCGAPGWGMVRTERGLPCGWCGLPTDLVRNEIHGCGACGHEAVRARADGRAEADPGSCPVCNP